MREKAGETVEIERHAKSILITRQRNFFIGCTLLAVIANFLLSVKIAGTSERIIMVPGITRDLVVEGSAVSEGYLEEWALLFASILLDLTPDTVELKRNIILKQVSVRSPQSLKSLQAYFAAKEAQPLYCVPCNKI